MIKKTIVLLLLSNSLIVNYSFASNACVPYQKAKGSILISAISAKAVCAGCGGTQQPDLVLKGDIFISDSGKQYVVTADTKAIDKRIPIATSINAIDTEGIILINAPDEYEPRPHYKPNLGFAIDSEIFFYHGNVYKNPCVYGAVGMPISVPSVSSQYYEFNFTRQDYYESPCHIYNPVAYEMGTSMVQVPIEAMEAGSEYNISSSQNIKLYPNKQYYALKNVGHITYKRDIVGGTDDCS